MADQESGGAAPEGQPAAELLPRELRSLGFGILACVNAVGDMASSLYVGALLERDSAPLAFGIAAGMGLVGVIWMAGWMAWRPAKPSGAENQ